MPSELVQTFKDVLVYIAIAIVTLVGLIKCIYPVMRNGALLNSAVAKLERGGRDDGRPVWRESRFLGRSLRADWQRFLLNAGQLDMRGMPCNTQDYINEDTAIYKPGHAQLAELIPGLLTSLGILGTFIGLMDGLSGLNFSDASQTIGSIPVLLSGMRYAFATSVAGISCSLVFNMVNRMMIGHAFKALDNFDEAFYELAMPRPVDVDVQLLCQKQDDGLVIQRAAEAMGNRLSGTMEISVSRALHPVTMAMDNLIQGVAREQVQGVERVAGQFTQQLNQTLKSQFDQLGQSMLAFGRSQVASQEQMRQAMVSAQALAQDAQRIQEASRSIADIMEKESEAAQMNAQGAIYPMLGGIAQQQADMVDSLGDMVEALNRQQSAMDNQLQISRQLGELTQAVENLSHAFAAQAERKSRRGLFSGGARVKQSEQTGREA